MVIETIVTRNGKIVWKHWLNWPFYVLMLRTKLYQNSFFFTVIQSVNKTKNIVAKTVYEPIFLPFYVIIISFFSFFFQDANIAGSNCALISCNLSKKHKFALHQTLREEPNYVDHKIVFLYFAKSYLYNGDRHPNTIELASWLVHVLCNFITLTSRSFSLL